MKKFMMMLVLAAVTLSASAEKKDVQLRKLAPVYRTTKQNNLEALKAATHKKMAKTNATLRPINKRKEAIALIPGKKEYYDYSSLCETMFGPIYTEGMANMVSYNNDSTNVYIRTLFPFTEVNMWIKGNVAGNKVTFDSKKPVFAMDYFGDGSYMIDMYVGELILDEEEENIVGVGNMTLTKDGLHIYDPDVEEAYDEDWDEYYLDFKHTYALFFYEEDEEGNKQTFIWDYCSGADLTPHEGELNEVVIPKTAESKEFVYKFLDDYSYNQAVKASVAVDGNDAYFTNLSTIFPEGCVKGTKEGDKVTIEAGQFLGADVFYYYFGGMQFVDEDGDGEIDMDDNWNYVFKQVPFVLDYDRATYTFTQADPEIYAATFLPSGEYFGYSNDYVINPFTGVKPAAPADPDPTNCYYMPDYDGYKIIEFSKPYTDANFDYIDPANLYYSLYLDGELVTFSQDDFEYFDREDTEMLPFSYSDAEFFDIISGGSYVDIYLPFEAFEKVGIQFINIVDGQAYYSNILYFDEEGEAYLEPDDEANHATGIVRTKADVKGSKFFDINGRQLTAPQRGVNIVKQTQADGSVKTIKMIRK